MFCLDWDEANGWHDARIVPYGPLHLAPSAMVFHYGQEIFEGLKAFKHGDGSIKLFRPDRNAARFNRSAVRMSMPEVPVEHQIEASRQALDRGEVDVIQGMFYSSWSQTPHDLMTDMDPLSSATPPGP
jgi:branched-chain amino acid aminotransferase